jgi:hypothetical protein
VRIGKPHSLVGQPIEMGCLELALAAVDGWLAVSDVVKQDKDDVRFLGGSQAGDTAQANQDQADPNPCFGDSTHQVLSTR